LLLQLLVVDLQANEAVRELAVSKNQVVRAKLHFEVLQHVAKVLLCFLVIHDVEVLHHLLVVVVKNEFAPDLDDLREESLCFFALILLFEQLAHVIVARAHAVIFGAELDALQVNALRKVLQSVVEGLRRALGKEKSAEGFVQASLKTVNLLLANALLVRAFLRLVRGRFEQVPEG